MEAVLGVSDLDFDPSQVTDVSQLTAEEFLLYVRYEANHCPDVVRATVDSSQFGCQTEYMPRVKDIPVCHDMFLPSVEWENEVVETFSRFRQVSGDVLGGSFLCVFMVNLCFVCKFCVTEFKHDE
jgi:hypothetical protein